MTKLFTAKTSNVDPLERRLNRWCGCYAQIWDHYNLTLLKVGKPNFSQKKPNGKSRFLVNLRKLNTLIAYDYTNNNNPVSTSSDAAQHFAGKSLLCKLDCYRADHRLQMADNGPWRTLHSILPAEPLPTEDLHKLLAGLCLLYQASCTSTRSQLSKMTNVLNTWTLELQPTLLWILPGMFWQSSSAFAKQDWNW